MSRPCGDSAPRFEFTLDPEAGDYLLEQHEEGESIPGLAAELGTTAAAVRRAIEAARDRRHRRGRSWCRGPRRRFDEEGDPYLESLPPWSH